MAPDRKDRSLPLIIALSIAIPLIVTLLYLMPKTGWAEGTDLRFLPLTNAIINGTTTLMLIAGGVAVKQKRYTLHQRFMTMALVLSACFLISYVIYHASAESTSYGGEGALQYIYYFILLTHILLAIVIVPLVLITVVRAWSQRFDRHKKIARITLPLWLYVTVTGVLVYVMISPYY